jgi:hypothetical protein
MPEWAGVSPSLASETASIAAATSSSARHQTCRADEEVAVALAAHEVSPEIQICLVLIVGPAAQRDVVCLMLSAFPIGLLVMILHAARASATTTLLIDERATTTVALPYLASDRRWDGACSAIVSSIAWPSASTVVSSIALARVVGDRGLLLERIVE